MSQIRLNPRNGYYADNLDAVNISTVQQVNDRAYFRRGNHWYESRLINEKAVPKAKREIAFGSDEYKELLEKLISENRQGTIALRGDIMMLVEGEPVLIKAPVLSANATPARIPNP